MRSRKGGMIKGSSIHKHIRHEEELKLQREGYKNLEDGRSPSSAFQHIVNDNQEHQDDYGWNHPEDLNTEKEHDKWKEENPDVDPDQREVEDDPNVGAMKYRSPMQQTMAGASMTATGNVSDVIKQTLKKKVQKEIMPEDDDLSVIE